MKYYFFAISIFLLLASASEPKGILPKQIPSLSELVIDHHPDLVFKNLRYQSIWDQEKTRAYVLGTLLSNHLEYLVPRRSQETFYLNSGKLLSGLKSLLNGPMDDKPRKELAQFVSTFYELVEVGLKSKSYICPLELHSLFFTSSRSVYPSVALSIAFLKSLHLGRHNQKTQVPVRFDFVILQSMFGLLHIPIINDWVRPDLMNLVSYMINEMINEENREEFRECLFSNLATLPDEEPVKILLMRKFIPIVSNDQIASFVFRYGPICSPSVVQAVSEIVEKKWIDTSFANARNWAIFNPIIYSGPIAFKIQTDGTYQFNYIQKYVTQITMTAGKIRSPFPDSSFYMNSSISSHINNLSDADLSVIEGNVILCHALPLTDEFKEQMRFMINGNFNGYLDGTFHYILNAAGVVIFNSKVAVQALF